VKQAGKVDFNAPERYINPTRTPTPTPDIDTDTDTGCNVNDNESPKINL